MKDQKTLFKEKKPCEDEWQGMPEFDMEDQSSFRKIVVHFRNQEDVDQFAYLMSQKITAKIPSIWFPELKPRRRLEFLYEDEE